MNVGGLENELPLRQLISFNKLLEHYEVLANGDDFHLAARAQQILDLQAPYPILRDGFDDLSILKEHEQLIRAILQDTFPTLLGGNEIKAVSMAFNNLVFNPSKRFQKILEDAGPDFELKIRNQSEGIDYIMACTVILNFYYGYRLDFRRPYFYDIPDAQGVMRHYRILYNADFVEILPTDKAKNLTQDDLNELLENPENLELWKEKIPPHSFVSKGFVISNMFDVSAEYAISEIKSKLIDINKANGEDFLTELQETFRSFFNIPNIRTGFVAYNAQKKQLERIHGKQMQSFILCDKHLETSLEALCDESYSKLMTQNSFFGIADVERQHHLTGGNPMYKNLLEQGIKSAIFAPIVHDGELLGILELVSESVNELNSVNATKLVDVMPYLVSAVLRSKVEEANLIDAVIQNECTSVHPAVLWQFQEEAKRFIDEERDGGQPSFKEIVFKDVFPLYGQIDIAGSSQARNMAIQRDLMIELSEINAVLEEALRKKKLPIYEELMFRINNHLDEIKEVLNTNSEQAIFDFVKSEITPVFKHLKKTDKEISLSISQYEARIDTVTESYYDHRRNYDESVMQINKKLATVMDKKQEDAQAMYPHYFERFKTDGVEHNMYIGNSITKEDDFDTLYLNNLRLWQLQVMCEMENAYYKLKPKLPIQLDVSSLILVYNTPLSIRFRMDEKRFDVDGTYNARYEVIKKRIDKSYIKGTSERLTQVGKLAIVYSQKKDELEYLRYIKFLKSKGYFGSKVEIVELEGLQGVAGLKAIRAEILYKTANTQPEKTFTYQDLMNELKADK